MKKENIKSLKSHIKYNDYFGTLATILSLIRQNIEKNKNKELNIETLNKIEKDLLYLQKNYKILINMNELEQQFTEDMHHTYNESVKLGYTPTRFLQMIYEYGGVKTAQKLLNNEVLITDGITRLWELGRLDLSIEAKVIKEEYVNLFTKKEIIEAKRRLAQLDYNNS